ncbi:hypothetical protein MUK42_01548 [Musa troglodytarum]|uniref:Uncharacterized protein n=1 Tax=Musa troglodytarum TaxID=320322 RepID=A0A9E7G0H5_9LILI|nr:hypothetical protein MUK42_01548 [Musa troglodytarum]
MKPVINHSKGGYISGCPNLDACLRCTSKGTRALSFALPLDPFCSRDRSGIEPALELQNPIRECQTTVRYCGDATAIFEAHTRKALLSKLPVAVDDCNAETKGLESKCSKLMTLNWSSQSEEFI